MILIFVFFFSSRRRHTRCLSDWSSDVCSSDLPGQAGGKENGHGRHARHQGRARQARSEGVAEHSVRFVRQLLPFASLLLVMILLSVLKTHTFLTTDNFLTSSAAPA